MAASQTHEAGPPDSTRPDTLRHLEISPIMLFETGLILRDTITIEILKQRLGIFSRQSKSSGVFEIRENAIKDTQSNDIRPRDIRPKMPGHGRMQPLIPVDQSKATGIYAYARHRTTYELTGSEEPEAGLRLLVSEILPLQ